MSKRALILWVCLGTLLLSAAKVTTVFQSEESGSPALFAAPETEMSPADKKFQLLSATYGPSQPAVGQPRISTYTISESTLWLARAIYSETKLPHEQELVAWVIRNRVETGYRGQTTYKDVILDPYQFSAFNPSASRRSFYLSLTPEVQLPAWQQALWIAHYVRHADSAYRPFSIETRHFYSQRSMRGRDHPFWVNRQQYVQPGWDYQVNDRRFRFYKEIS
jgi:hypothetical protein